MKLRLTALAGTALLLGGCVTAPDTVTHQRPQQRDYPQQYVVANGSIYQANAYRPIFEDHKARMIGDNLTIIITESNTATKAGSDAMERSNELNANAPTWNNKQYNRLSGSASGNYEIDASASRSNRNVFSGTIAVTVIDVTPNGNLIVSGEKQIAMDNGSEFIRFSGVIDPKDITVGNEILSTKVADARVEYRTNTRLDGVEFASKLTRFFLSVLPF